MDFDMSVFDHPMSDEEFEKNVDKLWEEITKDNERRRREAEELWNSLSEEEKERQRYFSQWDERFMDNPLGEDS